MSLDVASVMDGLATRLRTISGLRVFAYPPDAIAPPAAVVSYPEPLEWDVTMGPSPVDHATVSVHVAVGRVSDRAARDKLASYMAGSGASSVKAAIEADGTLGGAADSTSVVSVTGLDLNIGGVAYVAATFTCDVIG